ncbi:MAG: hypothetical protein ABEJ27_01590 [Halodesulfurarchaeum sp.]
MAPDDIGYGSHYQLSDPNGWIAFVLPDNVSEVPSELHVQFGGRTEGQIKWPFPERPVKKLNSEPPAFELKSLSIPSSVPTGTPIEITLTITNHGGPGVFRFVVNETGPLYRPHSRRVKLEGGATTSTAVKLTSHMKTDARKVQFTLVTPSSQTEHLIRMQE